MPAWMSNGCASLSLGIGLLVGLSTAAAADELKPSAVIDVPVRVDGESWTVSHAFPTSNGLVADGDVVTRTSWQDEPADKVLFLDSAGRPEAWEKLESQYGVDRLLPLPDGGVIVVHSVSAGDQKTIRLTRVTRDGDAVGQVASFDTGFAYASVSESTVDGRLLIRPITDDPHLLLVDGLAEPMTSRRVVLEEENESARFTRWWLPNVSDDGVQHLVATRRIGSGRLTATELRRYTLQDDQLIDPKSLGVWGFAHRIDVDLAAGMVYAVSRDTSDIKVGDYDQIALDTMETFDVAAGERASVEKIEFSLVTDWTDLFVEPDAAVFGRGLALTLPNHRVAVVAADGSVSRSAALPNVIDDFVSTADGQRLLARSRAVYEDDGKTVRRASAIHLFENGEGLPALQPATHQPRVDLPLPLSYEGGQAWDVWSVATLDRGFIASVTVPGEAIGRIASFTADAALNGWPVAGGVASDSLPQFVEIDDGVVAATFHYVENGAPPRRVLTVLVRGEQNDLGGYGWTWAGATYLDEREIKLVRTNLTNRFALYQQGDGESTATVYDATPAVTEQKALSVVRQTTLAADDGHAAGAVYMTEAGDPSFLVDRVSSKIADRRWYDRHVLRQDGRVVREPVWNGGLNDLVRLDLVTGKAMVLTHADGGDDATFAAPGGTMVPTLNRLHIIDPATKQEDFSAWLERPVRSTSFDSASISAGRMLILTANAIQIVNADGTDGGLFEVQGSVVRSASMNTGGSRLTVATEASESGQGRLLIYNLLD